MFGQLPAFHLTGRHIEPMIRGHSCRRVKSEYGCALYEQCKRIEPLSGHLKIDDVVATRHDKLAKSFLGMVHLTARSTAWPIRPAMTIPMAGYRHDQKCTAAPTRKYLPRIPRK